jgi:hypothetical protein
MHTHDSTPAHGRVTRICERCGQSFTCQANRLKTRPVRYCSRSCLYAPPEERFWAKVAKSDGCWLWTGARWGNGYGTFAPDRYHPTCAHRYAYELTYGPIPDGHVVMHSCDNPQCVRPDHLSIGTQKDNLADMRAKGRAPVERVVHRGSDHPNSKLTDGQVRAIRRAYASGEITQKQIAATYCVSEALIGFIVNGRHWRHIK